MKLVKRLYISFLVFFLGLCPAIHASPNSTESFDLSNCQLLGVSFDQILFSDSGVFILDTKTNCPVPVDGFIYLSNQIFAIQALNISEIKCATLCGHSNGCKKCSGCFVKDC
jgi:hypothetical protein